MPVIAPPTIDYYDPVELVLNFARTIANDCAISLAGNLLADSQPQTLPTLQLAWRKLQNRLRNNSVEAFPAEYIYINLPPLNSNVQGDPAIQCFIGQSGYWDGATLWPSIVLPPNLMVPVKLFERQTGANSVFIPMIPASSGIPATPKSTMYRIWEWRDGAIMFPGAIQYNDLKVRFKQFFSDPKDTNADIPIIQAAVALAYLTVEVFAEGRGSTVTAVFTAEKEDAIKQLINTTTQKKQKENFRRRPYSRRERNRW